MKTASDYIRVNQMALQTWTACMQTIALRTELLSTHSPISPRVITEKLKMGTEKIAASVEICSQLQAVTLDLCHGRFDPSVRWENMLRPIRQEATGNARRLARQSRRR